MKIHCWFCDEELALTRHVSGTMREITGWEELRRGGGANKIVRRRTTGKWAHRACVEMSLRQSERLF